MRRFGTLVLLSCAAGCGTAGGPSTPRFPNPEPRVAATRATENQLARTLCARGASYDSNAGCVIAASGALFRVVFRNDASDAFRPTGVALALDGETSFETNDPRLLQAKSVRAITGRVEPGQHELGVHLFYAGNGYGVFSYLKGYRFVVRTSLGFEARPGRDMALVVVGEERGTPETPLEKRLRARLEAEW